MEPNYVAIIVAGIIAWVLGAVWYGPIFGKAWQQETGITDEEAQKGNMPLIFGTSALLMMIMMFGMTRVIQAHQEINFVHGAFHGMMIGLFFAACSMGINYLYQRKSIKLWLIDAGYQVAFLALGGGIMAWWPW